MIVISWVVTHPETAPSSDLSFVRYGNTDAISGGDRNSSEFFSLQRLNDRRNGLQHFVVDDFAGILRIWYVGSYTTETGVVVDAP